MDIKYIKQIKSLILDDEIDFTNEINDFLKNSGFITFAANNTENAYEILKNNNIDLFFLDVRLPGTNGIEVLKYVKSIYPDLEVIMVSAHGDMDTVIDAIRLGAFDYLRKPMRYIDLQIAIERTHKYLQMQRKLVQAEKKYSLITSDMESKIGRHCIGKSKAIVDIYDLVKTASQYQDTNVLITGESGTGKEIFARLIHYMSKHRSNYFEAINCGAISDALFESEFFGHKKGSFTGAISDKKGLLEVCNEGTLFLDEIADMPYNLQSKLLRAIEDGKIRRVGDTKSIDTNFRLISATNCDLNKMIKEKRFRLDLLHRLNSLHIHIPPLRERKEDISPLLIDFVEEFSEKFNKPIEYIADDVFVTLEIYDFPGNIRELRNMAERAIILSKGKSLELSDFPLTAMTNSSDNSKPVFNNLITRDEDITRSALEESGYNQVVAAEKLGISRYALIRKMKKYNIDIEKIVNNI